MTPPRSGAPHPPAPHIHAVEPAQREAAVGRLLPGGGGGRRFLDWAREAGVSLETMWCILDAAGRPEATLLAVPGPGRTAVLFATPPASAEAARRIGLLIEAGTARLAEHDVALAQVLLEPDDRLGQAAFGAGGFRRLAEIDYMERPIARRGPRAAAAPPMPGDVRLLPYDPEHRADVLGILEASYEATLDCPGLRGLRRTEDVLAGHEATGRFTPELWRLLLVDERPGGVMMLNAAPASDTIELVYLGLAAPARGRGLGTLLLRDALHRLASRDERAVTLAVDAANAPALRLYRAEGFRRVLRRVAMIRPIDG